MLTYSQCDERLILLVFIVLEPSPLITFKATVPPIHHSNLLCLVSCLGHKTYNLKRVQPRLKHSLLKLYSALTIDLHYCRTNGKQVPMSLMTVGKTVQRSRQKARRPTRRQ